jgi:hypothetical protein
MTEFDINNFDNIPGKMNGLGVSVCGRWSLGKENICMMSVFFGVSYQLQKSKVFHWELIGKFLEYSCSLTSGGGKDLSKSPFISNSSN